VYLIQRSVIAKSGPPLGLPQPKRRCTLKVKQGVLFVALFAWLTTMALAQSRGGALTLHFTSYSPIVSLIAGIMILIFPRLLNYIVAFYLILVGLLGIIGR
jgi:hypothetical protein